MKLEVVVAACRLAGTMSSAGLLNSNVQQFFGWKQYFIISTRELFCTISNFALSNLQ